MLWIQGHEVVSADSHLALSVGKKKKQAPLNYVVSGPQLPHNLERVKRDDLQSVLPGHKPESSGNMGFPVEKMSPWDQAMGEPEASSV